MTISQASEEWVDFSVREWMRLDTLSARFDGHLKTAYLRTVVQNHDNPNIIKDVVTDAVVETGVSSARVYGMDFNANSATYSNLIDDLTNSVMKVVNNEEARTKVKEILPSGLSLDERNNRLDVFGLSGRDAVRLERMRQEGISGDRLKGARLHMSVQRGNIVALTEVNRIINATLEAVWIDNLSVVRKAKKKIDYQGQWYQESEGRVINITSLRGIPSRARKMIVTRKDNRTCDYCLPLDGLRTKIGNSFSTMYGIFQYPPFHPRCRCFMIVSF